MQAAGPRITYLQHRARADLRLQAKAILLHQRRAKIGVEQIPKFEVVGEYGMNIGNVGTVRSNGTSLVAAASGVPSRPEIPKTADYLANSQPSGLCIGCGTCRIRLALLGAPCAVVARRNRHADSKYSGRHRPSHNRWKPE